MFGRFLGGVNKEWFLFFFYIFDLKINSRKCVNVYVDFIIGRVGGEDIRSNGIVLTLVFGDRLEVTFGKKFEKKEKKSCCFFLLIYRD